MKAIDTGGQAYPSAEVHFNEDGTVNNTEINKGMTLRDYFAGQALANAYTYDEFSPDNTSRWAYEIADKMLEEREK